MSTRSATTMYDNDNRFGSRPDNHAVATSALTNTTVKLTPQTPVRSAIWQIAATGDCVQPTGSQGNSETVLQRSHSVATQTMATPAIRTRIASSLLGFGSSGDDPSSSARGNKRR